MISMEAPTLTVKSINALLAFVANNTPIDSFITVIVERHKIL